MQSFSSGSTLLPNEGSNCSAIFAPRVVSISRPLIENQLSSKAQGIARTIPIAASRPIRIGSGRE